MHPVRRAADSWKAANPGATDEDFAAFVGYDGADALYKQIRGEYIAPHDKLAKMADVLGWTPGRFLNACSKRLRPLKLQSASGAASRSAS